LTNGPAVSHICSTLKNLGDLLEEDSKRRVCCSLVQVLFEEHMSQASWYLTFTTYYILDILSDVSHSFSHF